MSIRVRVTGVKTSKVYDSGIEYRYGDVFDMGGDRIPRSMKEKLEAVGPAVASSGGISLTEDSMNIGRKDDPNEKKSENDGDVDGADIGEVSVRVGTEMIANETDLEILNRWYEEENKGQGRTGILGPLEKRIAAVEHGR